MFQNVVDIVVNSPKAAAAFVGDVMWRVPEHKKAKELRLCSGGKAARSKGNCGRSANLASWRHLGGRDVSIASKPRIEARKLI